MGTGEATGQGGAKTAAEAAITNPLLDEASVGGARGVFVSISRGADMTLFEVDEAATRICEEVDADAHIIVGAIFDDAIEGKFRVFVVATGLRQTAEDCMKESAYASRTPLASPQLSSTRTDAIRVLQRESGGCRSLPL